MVYMVYQLLSMTSILTVIINRLVKLKIINAHRGARTHDHKVKSLALYQLS